MKVKRLRAQAQKGFGARQPYRIGCGHAAAGNMHDVQRITREINKLAGLSAEGRSSATTLMVSSAVRWMNRNAATLPPRSHR
jgi:hypothetical protein